MQPFTVESIEESLILFGVDIGIARSAVNRVYSADEAVDVLTVSIAESVHGAVIDSGVTLQEGIDALAGPCRRGGVSPACSVGGLGVIDVAFGGETRSISCQYRPQEDAFHLVAHAIEKAAGGHIRIYPLRSTFGAEAVVYAVLSRRDWERLLAVLGAPAFDMLFVGLDGTVIV